MFLHVLRAIFILVVAAVAMSFIEQDPSNTTGALQFHKPLILLSVVVVALTVIIIDVFIPHKSLLTISALFFGVVSGMVLAFGVSMIVDLVVQAAFPVLKQPVQAQVLVEQLIPETDPHTGETKKVSRVVSRNEVISYRDHPIISTIKIIIGIICCYLSVSFILQTKDDVRFVIPYVEFAKQVKGAKPLLLDTSVIIDGRIADICETRIVESELIVPRFVLAELQLVADSADKLKRNRGRRGLDILNRMQLNDNIDVQIKDVQMQRGDHNRPVDEMLVELGAEMDGRIATTDYNLNKVAQLRGVPVININDVANALKPVFLPGEQFDLKILRPGEEPGQGVGYLEDGTMVVTEGARDLIGQLVSITVTSVLQTSAGRMIFGRPVGTAAGKRREELPRSVPTPRRTSST